MSEQEGPYKLTWDAGIKRHTLSGPGLEENNNLRCGLRLELEPDLDNFNYVWHSRDTEVAELKDKLKVAREALIALKRADDETHTIEDYVEFQNRRMCAFEVCDIALKKLKAE